MRNFTDSDVRDGRIQADRSELVYNPPDWMRQGLQETATGYGKRLNSGYSIRFNGRLYRIYVTINSNNGTCWFRLRGQRYIVNC